MRLDLLAVDFTTDTSTRPGPVRTCVGCRQRAAKAELLRVVVGPDANGSSVVPDPGNSIHGRGAHLHPTTECFELAQRRRALPRALRLTGGADADAVADWITSQDDETGETHRD